MIETLFNSATVAQVCGISYRQLDYWCRVDVFGGEHGEGRGIGRPRRFSASEVQVIDACATISGALAGPRLTDGLRRVARRVEEWLPGNERADRVLLWASIDDAGVVERGGQVVDLVGGPAAIAPWSPVEVLERLAGDPR